MPVKYVCSKCATESSVLSSGEPAKEWMTLKLAAGTFDLCPECQILHLKFLSPLDFPTPVAPSDVPVALANAVETTPGPVPEVIDGGQGQVDAVSSEASGSVPSQG